MFFVIIVLLLVAYASCADIILKRTMTKKTEATINITVLVGLMIAVIVYGLMVIRFTSR